jgi:hypothetical protein
MARDGLFGDTLTNEGGSRMDPAPNGSTGEGGEFAHQVAAALDKIRPALQADGGDIVLVAIEGQDARVRLTGACHG